jgi:hypothetical protein
MSRRRKKHTAYGGPRQHTNVAVRIGREGQPCPTQKRIYRDKGAARYAVAKAAKAQGLELYLYGCRYCRGYHLTSRSDQGATRA